MKMKSFAWSVFLSPFMTIAIRFATRKDHQIGFCKTNCKTTDCDWNELSDLLLYTAAPWRISINDQGIRSWKRVHNAFYVNCAGNEQCWVELLSMAKKGLLWPLKNEIKFNFVHRWALKVLLLLSTTSISSISFLQFRLIESPNASACIIRRIWASEETSEWVMDGEQ